MSSTKDLTQSLEALLRYVPLEVIECHGDKCRKDWCASCNGEDSAAAAIAAARKDAAGAMVAMMLASDETPPPSTHVAAYRLLSEGEIIQKGDQPLNDNCNSWGELVGWEIGIAYYPSVFVPIRRALSTTEGSTDA